MAETLQIRHLLQRFGCTRGPTLDCLTVTLGLNTVDSLVMMDKNILKDIKRQLQDSVDVVAPADQRVDCNVSTMVAIDMASKAVQDLAHRGVEANVALLISIDAAAVRHYREVARHLASTKSSKDEEITLTKLPGNTRMQSGFWRCLVFR